MLIYSYISLLFNVLNPAVFGLRRILPDIPNDLDLSSLQAIKNTKNQTIDAFLPGLLVPRPPNSDELVRVRNMLVNVLSENGWTVELDKSVYTVSGKNYEFTNIIGSLNPGASKFLTISAHYESKIEPSGFVGATDSAGPCAMLLELAVRLGNYSNFKPYWNLDVISPQIVFFDGEEAIKSWTRSDSLYGSRHLAESWTKQKPKSNLTFEMSLKKKKNRIDQIDMLILFDLLGSVDPFPEIPNYFPATSSAYQYVKQIEIFLEGKKALSELRMQKKQAYFSGKSGRTLHIDDDHRPFYEIGAPILHVIPRPFPKVWHKIDDNETILKKEILKDFLLIFNLFILQYTDSFC